MLSSFGTLLENKALVDVTLVCAEASVLAHKMVLSACSPFFQKIFAETRCEHPVIVLKDFNGWEVDALISFMYKGQVSVGQEQLQSLIKAAESLQVRGLANQDTFAVDKDTSSIMNQTPTPSTSPNDYDRQFFSSSNKFSMHGMTMGTSLERSSPFSPVHNTLEPPVKLPHMSKLSFPETLLPRSDCQSPIPRRKQARPRRRSGELSGPQDLSTSSLKPSSPQQSEDRAENLCMKKKDERTTIKVEERKSCSPEISMRSPEMDLSVQSGGKEFSPTPVSAPQPTIRLKQEIDSQLSFPPMPTVSALAMTPPHSKFFGLDAPLGLFPPSLDSCRNPLFDIGEHRNAIDSPMFVKKKMGRPKGQHSAPRGGPPRSWTNAELTEALQQVWNKKMTTSQASRIFGIPYNSLLMYVRGKYGKSLKLEQLRKDCIGGLPQQPMDILGNMNGNNNNMPKGNDRDQESLQNPRPSSTDQDQPPPQQHPLFNPFGHNFYPDFGTGFPIPVSMIHLLPQGGDKNRAEHQYGQTAPHEDIEMKSNMAKEIDEESGQQDIYRPSNLNSDDRRELVHQNGQD